VFHAGYQGFTHWVVHSRDDYKVVQSNLEEFIKGGVLRRAQYNVSSMLSSVGYYKESANNVGTIVNRARVIMEEGMNWYLDDESFAVFCCTGNINREKLIGSKVPNNSKKVALTALGVGLGFAVGVPIGLFTGGTIGMGIFFAVTGGALGSSMAALE